MARAWKWFTPALALAVLAIGAGMVISKAHKDRVAADAFAARPAKDRNLAVFDAASALLQKNYFDSKFFATPEWKALHSEWRAKAVDAETLLLYANVLDNLAQKFPESHVAFVAPPPHVNEEAAPPSDTVAKRNAVVAAMYARAQAGPGFDAPVIRRALGKPQIVGDLLRGSPAERAGIAPGWILMSNNINVTPDSAHYSAEFLELDSELACGNETTGQVQLSGIATKEELEAAFEARRVKVEFELEDLPAYTDFETRLLPGDVTYLRFDSFDPHGPVGKALDVIEAAGSGGLILDLRHNYGGRQLELMRVTGKLLGSGVSIGNSRSAERGKLAINSFLLGDHYLGPLVVLIGPASASAAEIAAAAIQDQHRGKLIGRSTAGTVVVANLFDLPDGGKLMLPVSDFVRAGDRRIEAVGVQPDIWVSPTLEDVRAGRDPALERALKEISRR